MPRPRLRALPAAWAALAAGGGGLMTVLAFPRFGWWPLAFVGVAVLTLAVHGQRARRGAWLGYVYGAAFLLPLLHWAGVYVGAVPWLILALTFAVFFAVLGACLAALSRLRGFPFLAGAAWVLEEALRDRVPFGGFPWGRLAFSQAESPLRWLAAVGGAPLVTCVVGIGGALLAYAAQTARQRRWRMSAIAAAGCVALPLLAVALGQAVDPGSSGPRTITIAVIQGGLPDRGLVFEDRARQVLDNHIAATKALAAEIRAGRQPQPDLVLWPENASDVDPFQDPSAYAAIDDTVRAINAPVLVGAILQGPGAGHRRNVGILWSPTTGPGATYTKRHPVPFGEYIPLRWLAESVSSFAKSVSQDMVAGRGNGVLTGGPVPIGDVICFEVAYDDLVRSSVQAGAGLLVVQTNNATFGHTAETDQQLAMSRLRAVESARTVVQVATTGRSAIIGPDGALRAESGALFAPATLVNSVPVRYTKTIATRLAAVPEWSLAGLAVAGWLVAAWGPLIARRRGRRNKETESPIEAQEEMVNT